MCKKKFDICDHEQRKRIYILQNIVTGDTNMREPVILHCGGKLPKGYYFFDPGDNFMTGKGRKDAGIREQIWQKSMAHQYC